MANFEGELNASWEALKYHFMTTLCPPVQGDHIYPVWPECSAKIIFKNSSEHALGRNDEVDIELAAQGGLGWPWKNGSKTCVRLRFNNSKRAQYFVDAESACASLEKKKAKLGKVCCIQTFRITSIYDGDVYYDGTNRILYSS